MQTPPKITKLMPVRHTDPDSWEPPRSWTASRIPSARLRAIHLALGDGRDRPNPRMVFSLTETGTHTLKHPKRFMSTPARRLLGLLDGRRSLGEIPAIVRPADLPEALKELIARDMIALTGISRDAPPANDPQAELKLQAIKRALAGAFEAELGPNASVLEARIQDCVNLQVLRNVLREVINLVSVRKNPAAAHRIAVRARRHGPL
ncbi:MAG: hypothetical protein Q4B17_09580 [Lautropia sp.]|nr:hypothetical protein [Lautropia sp.]